MTNHIEVSIAGSMGQVWFQRQLDEGLGPKYDTVFAQIKQHVERDHGIPSGDPRYNPQTNDHLAAAIRPADKQSLDDSALADLLHLPRQ